MRKKGRMDETSRLREQIAELREEIRQLKETVGMLVSIVMEDLEEEDEGIIPKDDEKDLMFYN